MTHVNEGQKSASEAKSRSLEDLRRLVELHGLCLKANGAKTSPVLLRNAAAAVAKYEAAKANQ